MRSTVPAENIILMARTDRSALVMLWTIAPFRPEEVKHIVAAVLEEPRAVLQLTRCCFAPQDF